MTGGRQRLRDLEQELAEAEEWSDLGRLDAIHAERDALLAELTRATGLHRRSRVTGSSQERARVAVRKAITAATDRIATIDPPLAQHLQTTIHTGLSCAYEPDPANDPWVWVFDEGSRTGCCGIRGSGGDRPMTFGGGFLGDAACKLPDSE